MYKKCLEWRVDQAIAIGENEHGQVYICSFVDSVMFAVFLKVYWTCIQIQNLPESIFSIN